MAKSTKKASNLLTMPKSASTTRSTIEADIASRAFELYCQRGCQAGHDVEDWLQAERELLGTATPRRRAERTDAIA